jgi:hypothetical protein
LHYVSFEIYRVYPSRATDIRVIQEVLQRRIQDFKLGGALLIKLRRAEGGANLFWVFRVKNHDFTPKNHIFFQIRGEAPPGSTLYSVSVLIALAYF